MRPTFCSLITQLSTCFVRSTRILALTHSHWVAFVAVRVQTRATDARVTTLDHVHDVVVTISRRECDHVIGQILADVDCHLVRRLVQGVGAGTVAGDPVRPLRIRYPVQVPSRVIVGGGVEGAGIPAIRCPVKAKVMSERNKSRREVQGQGWRQETQRQKRRSDSRSKGRGRSRSRSPKRGVLTGKKVRITRS